MLGGIRFNWFLNKVTNDIKGRICYPPEHLTRAFEDTRRAHADAYRRMDGSSLGVAHAQLASILCYNPEQCSDQKQLGEDIRRNFETAISLLDDRQNDDRIQLSLSQTIVDLFERTRSAVEIKARLDVRVGSAADERTQFDLRPEIELARDLVTRAVRSGDIKAQ